MAVAVQHCMVLDASMFQDCQPLQATLLSTPFVGILFFGGQFQSSIKEARGNQEQVSQVRCFASAGSKADKEYWTH